MALSYEQSAALMLNPTFRGRVKVACLKYADFISLEAVSVPAHTTRLKWAQNTFANPEGTAQSVTPVVVMDPAVTAGTIDPDGDSSITDAALQSAVEAAVNKTL